MNYKEAISTPTQPPPKATETPYLTIDEAYDEIQASLTRAQYKHQYNPETTAPVPMFMDASDHVANIYNQLTAYWRTKGYLTKDTVISFCDMLKDVFHVEYVNSEDEEST
jgi:hypothetical protein